MLDKLKNLNQLRSQAKRMKQELGQELMTGSAEEGKIQITMDGNQDIKEVRIEPELFDPEHKDKVEAGVKEALSQCHTQIQMLMARKIQNGGLF